MEIDVREIAEAGLHLSYAIDSSQWDLMDKGILFSEPIHIVLDAIKHSEGEVCLSGQVSTTVSSECSRCLNPVSCPICADFQLEYVPFLKSFATSPSSKGEPVLSSETLDRLYYRGDLINLDDEIMKQLFLSLPTHPVCQPDCRGLCSSCGGDLNKTKCHCSVEFEDFRWATLKNFKYKETNAKSKT